MKKLPLAFATIAAATVALAAPPVARAQVHHDVSFGLGADSFAGTASTAASRAVAAQLEQAAQQILSQLSAGTLVDPNGNPISAEAQQLILSVIQGIASPDEVEQILLASGAENPSDDVASLLVGLLTSPKTGQISSFIARFNDLVNEGTSDAFFQNPPDVFRAIWAIADRLSQAMMPPGQ